VKQAVVLAGGKGTRLAPYTTVIPKPLMPLGDSPVIEVLLRQLARYGFERVVLAVGHLAELIEAFCGDGSRFGVRIEYHREDSPLGTAGPLADIGGLHEPFLVLNGDVLSSLDYGAFLDGHAGSGATASICTYTRSERVDFGVVLADAGGRVSGYVEKPSSDYLVSTGVYAFSPEVLTLIKPGLRLDFPDLVLRMLDQGITVRSVPFDGYWLDIGRHDDFARAQDEIEAVLPLLLGQKDAS
jgi:NDP-mannose synthase